MISVSKELFWSLALTVLSCGLLAHLPWDLTVVRVIISGVVIVLLMQHCLNRRVKP